MPAPSTLLRPFTKSINAHDVAVWSNGSWHRERVEGRVSAVAASADGLAVAVAYEADAQQIAVFRVADGALERRDNLPRAHAAGIDSLLFDPITGRLINASDDRTMIVWDIADLEERQRLRGHTDRIWNMAFAADGTVPVSASEDGTFRFWLRGPDGFAALGQPIVAGSTARAVAATPMGTLLVAYSDRVDEWLTTPSDWLMLACATAGRGLTPAEAEEFLGAEPSPGNTCSVAAPLG